MPPQRVYRFHQRAVEGIVDGPDDNGADLDNRCAATCTFAAPITGAQHDDIPELLTLARTISRREDEIIAAVLTGVTNARSEALNRLAKLEARMAYSFATPPTSAAASGPPAPATPGEQRLAWFERAFRSHGALTVQCADTAADLDGLLKARRALNPALRALRGSSLNGDIAVPRLALRVRGTARTSRRRFRRGDIGRRTCRRWQPAPGDRLKQRRSAASPLCACGPRQHPAARTRVGWPHDRRARRRRREALRA